MTETMAPFRALLKPSTSFYWDARLQQHFDRAKTEIIRQITDGVQMFDKNRVTCLATDWSKDGIGFFLTQKYCQCEKITPTCCSTGWKLVLAGSRFTKPAESRYHPVEGEALAVAYALHKTRYFILGCRQLYVATDHRPLLKIFSDRSLEDISNPRLLNFKEKTLQYSFHMIHVPGKEHHGPDSMSRNPVGPVLPVSVTEATNNSLLAYIRITEHDGEPDIAEVTSISALQQVRAVTIERIEHETACDPSLQELAKIIMDGFPVSRELCPNSV